MTKEMHSMNSLRSINVFKSITLLLAAIILGGCAGGVQMAPTLSKETNLEPQQGIVVARFINTSSYPLPFNYLTISPKNVNESDKIKPLRLSSLDSVITDSMIFAAPVKAGSYSMDSMYSFHSRGDYWYSRWASTDANFGTFEVKPGQVTDLGVIIYYPKPQEGRYTDEFTRLPADDPAQTLQQFFPFFKPDGEVLSWNDEGLDEELQDSFISFAQNPVTYESSYKGHNGDVHFFGKLGVIVKRTADGDWELDAVDTVVDMHTMVESKEGHLLIGGNEGQIFLKQPASEEWRSVGLSSSLSVDQLYIHDAVYVDALARNEKQVEVYRANLLDAEFNWSLMATYSRTDTWKNSEGAVQDNFVRKGQAPKKPSKKKITSVRFDDPDNPQQLTVELASTYVEQVFGNNTERTFAVDVADWKVTRDSSDREFTLIKNAGFTKVGVIEAGYWSWSGIPDYFAYDNEKSEWFKMTTNIVNCKEGL